MPDPLVECADLPIGVGSQLAEPAVVTFQVVHKGIPDPNPIFPAAGFDGFSGHGKLRTAFEAYELRGGLVWHDNVPEVAKVVFTGPIGLLHIDEWLPLTAHGIFASEADVVLFYQGGEVQATDF